MYWDTYLCFSLKVPWRASLHCDQDYFACSCWLEVSHTASDFSASSNVSVRISLRLPTFCLEFHCAFMGFSACIPHKCTLGLCLFCGQLKCACGLLAPWSPWKLNTLELGSLSVIFVLFCLSVVFLKKKMKTKTNMQTPIVTGNLLKKKKKLCVFCSTMYVLCFMIIIVLLCKLNQFGIRYSTSHMV